MHAGLDCEVFVCPGDCKETKDLQKTLAKMKGKGKKQKEELKRLKKEQKAKGKANEKEKADWCKERQGLLDKVPPSRVLVTGACIQRVHVSRRFATAHLLYRRQWSWGTWRQSTNVWFR